MKKILAILVVLVAAGAGFARQGTWNGGSSDMNLVTNWDGLSGAIASGDTLTANSGSAAMTLSANLTCSKLITTSGYSGNVSITGKTSTFTGGGIAIRGTGTFTASSSTIINLNGAGDSAYYDAGMGTITGTACVLNVNNRSCMAVINKAITLAAINVSNGSLTINGSAGLSLSASAVAAFSTANNSRLTVNVAVTLVRTTTGSPWSWNEGDTVNGTGAWTLRCQRNLPALTYTGSGAWTLTETSTASHNDSLTGNVNFGTANFTSGKASSGKCALHLNGYTLTCGQFNQTNSSATDTNFTYIGTGTLNCASKSVPASLTGISVLNLGTGTVNCTGIWTNSNNANEIITSGATSKLNAKAIIIAGAGNVYGYLKMDSALTATVPFTSLDSVRAQRVLISGNSKWTIAASKASRILSYTAGDLASGDSIVSSSPGTKCTLVIGGTPALTGVVLSDDVVYSDTGTAPSPPSVTMSRHYQDRQIIQRTHGQRYRDLVLSGGYTGTPSKIKAFCIRVADGDTLASAVIDSPLVNIIYTSAKAVLRVPVGNWYKIKVFALTAEDSVLAQDSSEMIACGMVFGLWGYSVQEGTDDDHGYTVADSAISLYDTLRTWQKLNDPIGGAWENINGATIAPVMGNKIWGADSMPVGFVVGAKSSTTLIGWCGRATNHFDTTTLYGRAASYLKTATDSGLVEGVVLTLGIYEARDGWTKQRWMDSARVLRNHIRGDIDSAATVYVTGLSPRIGLDTTTYAGDTAFSQTRLAQQELDTVSGFRYVGTYMDLPTTDGLHPTRSAQDTLGGRAANAVLYGLGKSAYYHGPRISSAINTAFGQVTITYDIAGLKVSSGNILYYGLINNSSVICDSGRIIAPDKARAWFSANPTDIRYAMQVNPDTIQILRLDSAYSAPAEIYSAFETTAEDLVVASGNYTVYDTSNYFADVVFNGDTVFVAADLHVTGAFSCASDVVFDYSNGARIIMPDCTLGTTNGNTSVVLTYPANCTSSRRRSGLGLNTGLMLGVN